MARGSHNVVDDEGGWVAVFVIRAIERTLARRGVDTGPILSALPELAVVIVTLPQTREAAYLAAFDTQWRQRPIEPIAGTIVEWP